MDLFAIDKPKKNFKGRYTIEKIDYQTAMEIVVKEHYLHRKAPCSVAYGLIDEVTAKVKGVVIYGKPASPPLCKGVCGEEEAENVYELTRLWIDDKIPKNGESFLVGNTLKMIDKEIIVSFAEIKAGHVGYIYQATNWFYTGLSAKHVEWTIKGIENRHVRHLWDEYGGLNKAKEVLGDNLVKGERPRKHRYIFFNCDKKRKKELLKKLRYEIKPYPKG